MSNALKGSVCLVGDVHGDYVPTDKIADNYIFLGDIGFGFYPLGQFCKKLDKKIHSGSQAYFIRGNHDDPKFWKDWRKETIEQKFPRFHMVEDYTILIICGKQFLCIGGGISIDRNYRVEGISYWKDEKLLPCPSENTFGEIYGVLSHTGFTPPVITHKHPFIERFSDVNEDVQHEQRVLFDVLNLYKPKVWFNGHYHVAVNFNVKDCTVRALNINEQVIVD